MSALGASGRTDPAACRSAAGLGAGPERSRQRPSEGCDYHRLLRRNFNLAASLLTFPARALAGLVVLAGAACPGWASAEGALLTRLDGAAIVVDGARTLAAATGLAVGAGSLVDTGEHTALLRLEWPDQRVIDLGPATRVMIEPPGLPAVGGQPPLLYLLQGWAKVSVAGPRPAAAVVMPALQALPFSGAAVFSIEGRRRSVFAESAALDLAERGSPARLLHLGRGAFYDGSAVRPRPSAEWLPRVPSPFRDSIPLRGANGVGQGRPARTLPPPAYAELEPWLDAEPLLRQEFPRRFAAFAQDPAFRRALKQNLSAHPEWARRLESAH
ncbi:MAG: hypothetical protein KGL43_26200 [Burkholderiales bacterium]|nr:hypothetical protein [Burkholderiales bacterium]